MRYIVRWLGHGYNTGPKKFFESKADADVFADKKRAEGFKKVTVTHSDNASKSFADKWFGR